MGSYSTAMEAVSLVGWVRGAWEADQHQGEMASQMRHSWLNNKLGNRGKIFEVQLLNCTQVEEIFTVIWFGVSL